MRVGLIARCDSTGLGVQSREFFTHIPCKALVIDFSNMVEGDSHKEILRPHFEWYPGQTQLTWGSEHHLRGDIPTPVIEEFIKDIDILFCIETPYDYNIFDACRVRGVKTILQLNYEFLDYPSSLPAPDLFAAPSMWNYALVPEPKIFLPVPVNTKNFTQQRAENTFVHIAGRPAEHDRNGTQCFLNSLQHVKNEIKVIIKGQRHVNIPHLPGNITIETEFGNKANYYENYSSGGVLVMPRKYGGLCLPMNEALASGMPVITTDISPNNLWLPDEWLVRSTHKQTFQCKRPVDIYEVDQLALARKIDEFCNRDYYNNAVDKACDLSNTISWEALREKYYEVLTPLLTY